MGDVSRETPVAPPGARRVFGTQGLAVAERYADLLATDGVLRGLIGPREAPRLWDRHLLNCAILGEVVADGVRWSMSGRAAGSGMALATSPARTCR